MCTEFLYQSSLPAGIGSNDIGLDRGQLGATRIVRFERSGPKVLLIQSNLDYRAVSNDEDERLAGVMGEGGIEDCGNAQNCVEVCPKDIPLTTAIGWVGRKATVKWLRDLFMK